MDQTNPLNERKPNKKISPSTLKSLARAELPSKRLILVSGTKHPELSGEGRVFAWQRARNFENLRMLSHN